MLGQKSVLMRTSSSWKRRRRKQEEKICAKSQKVNRKKKLAGPFSFITNGMHMLEERDFDYERFAKVERQVQEAFLAIN